MKKTLISATLILALLITLVLIPSDLFLTASAEAPQLQWSKTYTRHPNYSVNGNPVDAYDDGYAIIQTTGGGYAVTGTIGDHYYAPHSGGIENRTGLLIKTNALGEAEWEKAIGATYPLSIFQTKDSGFLISGSKMVQKTDSNGNLLWNKTFEGPWSIWDYPTYYDITSVIEAKDGGLVFAGSIPDYFEDAVVFKLDKDGNLLWNETSSTDATWVRANKLIELGNGDYAVVGHALGAWFARFDSYGDLKVNETLWEGYFNSIVNVDNDGFTLAGGTFIGGVENQGQGLLVRIDSEGRMKWNLTFDNPPIQGISFSSIARTGDGGYVVAGTSAMIKVDDFGRLKWNASYVDANLGSIVSVVETTDGGFAAVGTLNNSIWLAKFAAEQVPFTQAEPFPTLLVAATFVIVVAVVAIGVLVYFKKRKR